MIVTFNIHNPQKNIVEFALEEDTFPKYRSERCIKACNMTYAMYLKLNIFKKYFIDMH